MLCICGHTEYAHSETLGCRVCGCTGYRDETEVIFTEEEKRQWQATKKRVGLKKNNKPSTT